MKSVQFIFIRNTDQTEPLTSLGMEEVDIIFGNEINRLGARSHNHLPEPFIHTFNFRFTLSQISKSMNIFEQRFHVCTRTAAQAVHVT